MSDPSSYAGAMRLKKTIEEYWAKRGKYPKVTVEAEAFDARMRTSYYSVRSDMRNGKPRREAPPLRERRT